ncbi:MAG: YceI family protein [Steroidobacteraceae bacterium]|jgi:hypothetical protein
MPSNKLVAALSIVLLLIGCNLAPRGGIRAPPAGRAPPTPLNPVLAPRGTAVYRVDADRSELRVLVFRAGPMARLGHDHVIVNRALAGWIEPSAGSDPASFRLELPVAAFAVDETAARLAEGADFAAEIGDDAKQGTRHNLLGPALLDADAYPTIVVRSIGIEAGDGDETALVATVSIVVAGHESRQRIGFVLARTATQLIASADFRLRQSSLGLTPYSIMMGALQVQDEFRVKLRLVASLSTGDVDP